MDNEAGIDVSLEQSSLCAVDATGQSVREAKLASAPLSRPRSRETRPDSPRQPQPPPYRVASPVAEAYGLRLVTRDTRCGA